MFLFVYFSVLFYFAFHKNKIFEKSEKYKNSAFVYIGTCVPWMSIETKFSKLCIFCSLDEQFYAQLGISFLSLICSCVVCLKEKYAK